MSGYTTQQYDSLGNLILSWDSTGRREALVYDAADNRTQTMVTSGAPPSPPVELINLLDNAGFLVNQRGYASGSAVAAPNTYTLDRWRVVTAGQSVTWTDAAGVRTLVAPAGGIEQVIEGIWIAGDTYTLSWVGTATATVNGTNVANGSVAALPGGTNATVRFSGGTVAQPQLQRGVGATQFEWRHPALEALMCARYFQRLDNVVLFRANGSGNFGGGITNFGLLTRMRVTPTVTRFVVSGVYDDPVFIMSQTTGAMYFASGAGPDGIGQWCNYNLFLSAEF
jgi:YD repeat-containing protein